MDAPLISAASTGTDARPRSPELAGFMDKRGEHFRAAFKRRWFRLDGNELRWSETAGSAQKGSVQIATDFSVRISNHPEATRGELELLTSSRTFRLRCENAEAADRWIQGLSQAAEQLRKQTSGSISEAVPPESVLQEPPSYLCLVMADPQPEGVWPPRRPFATPVETAQRRLAFGVSLCTYSQLTGDRAASSILERIDADVLDCIGQQLAKLAMIPPLEHALQGVTLAQEASIVAQHLADLGADPDVRASMEMLGTIWVKRDISGGAFKGKWKALVNAVVLSRGLGPSAELGQLAVRRDRADGDWGFGYITQTTPLKVNAASAGRSSPGYEWGEVRPITPTEVSETELQPGEQVIFRDDAGWRVGFVTQVKPELQVKLSSSDSTSVDVMHDVLKFPAENPRVETLIRELNSHMESLPTTAALLRAVQLANAQLIETLADNGVDPDGVDHNSETALHCLAGAVEAKQPQHYQSVAALLSAGPSVDMKVRTTGQTALMRAAHRGYVCMCVQLLQAGADVSLKDIHGQDAKQWAMRDMPPLCTQVPTLEGVHRRTHIDRTATKVVGGISSRTVGRGRRIYGQHEATKDKDTAVLTIQQDGSLRSTPDAEDLQLSDPLAAKRLGKQQCLQILAEAKRSVELRARRRGYAAKMKNETKQEARMYLKGHLAEIKRELHKIKLREDEILDAARSVIGLEELELEPEPEPEPGSEPAS